MFTYRPFAMPRVPVFQSGEHLWDWLVHSNPIVGMVLGDLNLTKEQTAMVQQALERLVRERSGGSGPAVLTNPINIGIGTKVKALLEAARCAIPANSVF